jgi:hypothetical protein
MFLHMNTLDNLFLKVINDERLSTAFEMEPGKYSGIEEGKRSLNPYVRATAELIAQLNLSINEVKSDMRLRNKVGPVVMNESDFQPLYKKVVALLSK